MLKPFFSPLWTAAYSIGIVLLFLYSFTQIDLGLTVSRSLAVKQIETAFQYIGYFNRPLSSYFFIGIVLFLYGSYVKVLFSIQKISQKNLWILIFFSSILLAIAYNAFSYDLFNYIFDAKIVTHYQQNPYEHKALDYASEPMLSFMHWTHRVYPYGPVWLLLTIPVSYLGLHYFLLTFFLFKLLILVFFLATVWVVGKILETIDPKYTKFGIAFLGLSPFVLIESLVSAHLDIVMMFFIILGMYTLIKQRYIPTFLLLSLGYGVKFASADYPLPMHSIVLVSFAVGIFIFSKIQKKLSWETVFILAGSIMIIPIIFASMRTNFQPWYVLSVIPFAAVACKRYYVFIPTTIVSLFVLFEYVPYLYLGNWDPPVPSFLLWIRITGIGLAVLASIIGFFLAKRSKDDKIVSL